MLYKKEILYAICISFYRLIKNPMSVPCDKMIFPLHRAKVTFARPLFGIFYRIKDVKLS